jgi:hypothetical protein
MSRFLIQVLIIIILASVFELVLPWWSIALAAFAGGLVFRSGFNFIAGFLAIGLLWLITSIYINFGSAEPLTERVANIFMVNKVALFATTSLLGGLVGGFAAMAGSALRKDKRRMKYY